MNQVALRVAFVFLILCPAGCDGGSGGGMPQKMAFMGGDLRSGTSWATLRDSNNLSGCEWSVEAPERSSAGQAAPELGNQVKTRVETVATSSSCRHLGETGSMRLEFINDGLMQLEFIPDSFSAYREALKSELEKNGAVRKKVPSEESAFVLKDGTRVLIEERYSLVDGVSVSVVRRDDVLCSCSAIRSCLREWACQHFCVRAGEPLRVFARLDQLSPPAHLGRAERLRGPPVPRLQRAESSRRATRSTRPCLVSTATTSSGSAYGRSPRPGRLCSSTTLRGGSSGNEVSPRRPTWYATTRRSRRSR
jgi:hypothetical protein